MLKVFGKSILNGVFEQIHVLTKKYLKYQNTKYSICSISNTNYKKYFKYALDLKLECAGVIQVHLWANHSHAHNLPLPPNSTTW